MPCCCTPCLLPGTALFVVLTAVVLSPAVLPSLPNSTFAIASSSSSSESCLPVTLYDLKVSKHGGHSSCSDVSTKAVTIFEASDRLAYLLENHNLHMSCEDMSRSCVVCHTAAFKFIAVQLVLHGCGVIIFSVLINCSARHEGSPG